MYVFWKYNENIYLMFRWGRIVDLNSVCNSVGITNITETFTSYFSVEWEVSRQELLNKIVIIVKKMYVVFSLQRGTILSSGRALSPR